MLTLTHKPRDITQQRILHHRAKIFRKQSTPAEQFLWASIKGKQITDLRIRRQFPIDRYIVDFCCLKKKLIIEVDGSIHDHHEDKDTNRSLVLSYYGFTVIRFTNEQVLYNISDVIAQIKFYLSSPRLLQGDEGLGEKRSENDRPISHCRKESTFADEIRDFF